MNWGVVAALLLTVGFWAGVVALWSIAGAVGRIAHAMDGQDAKGSVVWWLETIASALGAGRN